MTRKAASSSYLQAYAFGLDLPCVFAAVEEKR